MSHARLSDFADDAEVIAARERYKQLSRRQHRLQMALQNTLRQKKKANIATGLAVLNAMGVPEGSVIEAEAFDGIIAIKVERAFCHKGHVTNINGPVVENTTSFQRYKRFGFQRNHEWKVRKPE